MRDTWPTAMAHRVGLSGAIRFTPARVGLTLHIPCEKGKHVVDFEVEKGLHPDFVAKRMLNKGWSFGSKLACPECSKGRKAKPQSIEQGEPATMATKAAANDAAPTPSEAARKAVRLALQFLEDYYDDGAKCYRPGWSDARIAEETGASEEAVRTERERLFGPLGEPAELTTLRADLDQLRRDHAASHQDYAGRIQAVQNRLAALCKAQGWPIPPAL